METYKSTQRIHLESLPTIIWNFFSCLLAIQEVPYTLGSIPLNAEIGKGSWQQSGRINGAKKEVLSFEWLPGLPSYEAPVWPVFGSLLTEGAGTLRDFSKPSLFL